MDPADVGPADPVPDPADVSRLLAIGFMVLLMTVMFGFGILGFIALSERHRLDTFAAERTTELATARRVATADAEALLASQRVTQLAVQLALAPAADRAALMADLAAARSEADRAARAAAEVRAANGARSSSTTTTRPTAPPPRPTTTTRPSPTTTTTRCRVPVTLLGGCVLR